MTIQYEMKSTHRDSLIVRRFLPTDSPPGLPQRPTMVSVPIIDACPADAATPTDVGVTAIAAAATSSSAPVEDDAAAATLSPSPGCTSRLAFWKYRGDLSAVLSARATKNTDSVCGIQNLV